MKWKAKKLLVRLAALILILAMIPTGVSGAAEATVQPRASDYLTAYSAYTYPAGGGRVEVYFSVTGTNYMEDIGSLSVKIYESTDNATWTRVKTVLHSEDSSMLGHDAVYHSGHVAYQGVAGRYYKAYVCVYAGKNGDGDSRYFWTSAKKAT